MTPPVKLWAGVRPEEYVYLFVCVYIYINVYTKYVYMNVTGTNMCNYVNMSLCLHAYIGLHKYANLFLCIYVNVYTCTITTRVYIYI